MQFDFHITGDSREDFDTFATLFARFAERQMLDALEGLGPNVNNPEPFNFGTLVADPLPQDEPPKRKRGRPKKGEGPDMAAPPPVPEELINQEPELPLTDGYAHTEVKGSVELSPGNNAIDDLLSALNDSAKKPLPAAADEPEKMRTKARDMLMELLERDPTKGPAITRLKQKYGVREFVLVPDERANELLADAWMLSNSDEAA